MKFRNLSHAAGISQIGVGVEIRNSLGETKRYHTHLRNDFECVHLDHPDLNKETLLQLVAKVCNNTGRPTGMVPALLVFGVVPILPIQPNELPKQQERMMFLRDSCQHMAKLTSQIRLQKAVNSRVTAATDSNIKIGDQALFYRDDPNACSEPFRVVDVNDRVVHIDSDGSLVQQSIDLCKRYHLEDEVHKMLRDRSNPAEVTL